jgi:hypothetical protein
MSRRHRIELAVLVMVAALLVTGCVVVFGRGLLAR